MSVPAVFDRHRLRQRRARAAQRAEPVSFLHEEVAERLVERLTEMRRRFGRVLELGAREGALAARLPADLTDELVTCDLAEAWLRRAPAPLAVAADEELLPFAPAVFDAVVSCMSLHWVNDLPGALAQIVASLRPDGLFLAAFPGGGTLGELRHALLEAELEIRGGSSPRVSPLVDLRDAAALVQRAGLALPVADQDRITVTYADPWQLMVELRAMGEAAALVQHGGTLRRDVLARALEIYRRDFADPATGRVAATFEIVFVTGWRPHASQPSPRPRGSGRTSLTELLPPPIRE